MERDVSFLRCTIKKQSPDVETPGLLVKALISSFFMSETANRLNFFQWVLANIAGKKDTDKRIDYFSISSPTNSINCLICSLAKSNFNPAASYNSGSVRVPPRLNAAI